MPDQCYNNNAAPEECCPEHGGGVAVGHCCGCCCLWDVNTTVIKVTVNHIALIVAPRY